MVHFTATTDYAEGKLPVHTAMCYNFRGWGNFAMDSLGIETNLCHPHATGKCCLRSVPFSRIQRRVRQLSLLPSVHIASTSRIFQHMVSIMTSKTTSPTLRWRRLQLGSSSSWWNFFAKYGTACANWAETFWTGSAVGCAWCRAVTPGATTTWASKKHGSSSRQFALLLSRTVLFWGIWFPSSEQRSERSTASFCLTLVSQIYPKQ